MPLKPVLIMAGGTGGHVYPALAVADYLRGKGVPLYWLGTRQGIEARVVPANEFPLLTISIGGLRGKGALRWMLAPFHIAVAVVQALGVLLRCRPGAVLGMGGFVSGPGGVAAWCLRIPLLIHEQNAVAGTTNRILRYLACRVLLGFPGALQAGAKVCTTGNPVRADITAVPEPAQRYGDIDDRPIRILVLGGSLGARRLNELVPATLRAFPEAGRVEIWHQAGEAHIAAARENYRDVAVRSARVEPFIEDMAAAYSWADLVVCRAGALTIAELCVAGVASILVPFPFAVDDHQTANARFVSEAGGAVLMPESQLDADSLSMILADILRSPQKLAEMARQSRSLGRPEATREVGDLCLEAIGA